MRHDVDDNGLGLTAPLADESATLALGAALAGAIEPGMRVYLCGDLGAGKTTLVRGLVRALGFAGAVKSPTYTLVEHYPFSKLDLYHFDFYRFNVAEEFLDAGLEEYFSGQGVCLVEWPDKAHPYVPPADVRIDLDIIGHTRVARVSAEGAKGKSCLERLIPRILQT